VTSLAEHLSSRKLTWDAAAKKTGLTVDRLRAVAAGEDASLSEMRRIASALKLPLSVLVDEAPVEPIRLLFRQTIEQRTTALSSAVEVVSAQIQDVLALASEAEMPPNTGWLDLFRGMDMSLEAVEGLANLFRRAYASLDDAEPFMTLPKVLANELGVFVLFGRDPTIEGVSAIVDGYALILVAARSFAPRTLFTLAHELGHLVARHDRRGEGYANLDVPRDVGGFRAPQKDEEKFADGFASALVLPRKGVLLALKEFRNQLGASGELGDIEIMALARFFGVSFEVAARRCEGLGLLPPRGARAMYQQLEAAHGNPERRAKELSLPDREAIDISTSPSLMDAAVKLVKAGRMSVGRAAEALNVPVSALFVANAGTIE
jgi:Zn-dependent peptidase ImmA (M78 family)